ncbi:MAG: hypothetical protein NE330_04700, partial [Lentisphaeraceae bacterium]|nr:hypothetical protein [Lentisphaeraceae bacterium]
MKYFLLLVSVVFISSCQKVEKVTITIEDKRDGVKKVEISKVDKSKGIKDNTYKVETAKVETVPKKDVTQKFIRPAFYIKNKGLKPQSCNLPFIENGKLVVPDNMLIHDYFKHDGTYHFAVSIDSIKFLLNAKDINKEKVNKDDLDLAFKFAKYCRKKASKLSIASVTIPKSTS